MRAITNFPFFSYNITMTKKRHLPIGIQTFEELISKNCVYIDKTQFIQNLISVGKPYFLSRPRRFGKSLFLSTLKSYFEGRKDLFEGLAISKSEKEWKKYPVFYFDFNGQNFDSALALYISLDNKISEYEKIYGKKDYLLKLEAAENVNKEELWKNQISIRFKNLIKSAYEKTGEQVVVLVDEYDKPLFQNVENEQIENQIRNILKGFYGNLKSEDAYIRFVFITGVTRFDKVSIFSDLNNLRDISMSEEFSAICGIIQEELEANFVPEIANMAEKNEISKEECLATLKKNYDGYHFTENTKTDIYNPFSLLNAFSDLKFSSYWFSTGTPTFLTLMIRNSDFDFKTLENDIEVGRRTIENYRLNSKNVLPMLYQTGYITIKEYDKEFESFVLGLPNDEVRYGLYENLVPLYAGYDGITDNIEVLNFLKEIRYGKVDDFMKRINNIFASAPKKTNQKMYELDCQAFVWLIFKLMGEFIICEVQNGEGRSDAVLWEKEIIYIFEFKMDATAQEAIDHINSQDYPIAYKNDGRKIIKVGVNYSSEKKQLTDWIIQEE